MADFPKENSEQKASIMSMAYYPYKQGRIEDPDWRLPFFEEK